MRDSNGYITKALAGRKKQSATTKSLCTAISFPHELQRLSSLMSHASLTLDHETRSSVSLMVRRALALLSEHQQTLVTPLDIQEERMAYRWMAKTGNPARVNG